MNAEAATSAPVHRLLREAAAFQTSALAPSTWVQYGAHLAYFYRFLLVVGLSHYLSSPNDAVFCAYAAFLARTCTASTVRNYFKGLRYLYAAMGMPVAWAECPCLQRVLVGLRRVKGEGTQRKLRVDSPMLMRFARALPPTSGVFGHLRLLRSWRVRHAAPLQSCARRPFPVWPGQAPHVRRHYL